MNQNFENLLKKYYTARIDIKNSGNFNNKIVVLENSDLKSSVIKPEWFVDSYGEGISITSEEGVLDLKIKCINDGTLNIYVRSTDNRAKNGERFPVYIDYTDFLVNDDPIFDDNKLLWHDYPYIFSKKVSDSEVLDIHFKWLPFSRDSVFNPYSDELLVSLKEKLELRERQIKSIPQLCSTTLGYPVLNGRLIYRNYPLKYELSVLDDWNGYCDRLWFTRYLKHKFPDEDFKINLFGVFNPHDNLAYPMEGKKVLYSTEDLNYRFLELKFNFDTYALEYVDLALGFDIINDSKYLRFPYWILEHISPESTEEDIEKKVASWNSTSYEKTKDVASISRHDWGGTRTLIDNDINKYANVVYAGKWKNNTSELQTHYHNNKSNFLKEFKFNLCPENLLVDAYVSEKIFDAIASDCIPLYAGGGNYLEPKIINQKAIIRWDGEREYNCNPETYEKEIYEEARLGHYFMYPVKWVANDDRNSDSVELFKNLISDKKTYDEFKDQDKVLDSSSKHIIRIMSDLEKHFERLIYS